MATLFILLGNPAVNQEIEIKVSAKIAWITVATARITEIINHDSVRLTLIPKSIIRKFAPGNWGNSYNIQISRVNYRIRLETIGEVNENNVWTQTFDVRKDQPTSLRLKDEIFPQQKIDLSRENNQTIAKLKGWGMNPDIKLC